MKVLVITGDKNFKPGKVRYELQKSAVEQLDVVYWGRGSLWPTMPQQKFDVVTSQDPFWRGLFAWEFAKKIHAKFNVQVHADLLGQSLIKCVLAQIVLRHATSVRVVSEKIKNQVTKMNPNIPITMLPIFVDIEPFKNIVRVPHEGKNILWIGRFESEKDPLLALEVFKKIHTERPDAKLLMLGVGSLQNLLKAQAQNLPVEFPGWVDPKPYLVQADVVLSTSRHESWGASIVEALAAGVPVVAPDVGVAKEAGATILPRHELSKGVLEVLASGQRATLRLSLLTKDAWSKAWAASLS